MNLKLACDALRAAENKEVAALVVQDKALQRVLAVWPMVRRTENPVSDGVSDFDGLWAFVEFDDRDVVDLSGLQTGVGIAAFRRARTLRLVYPDGSVHQVARLVLQQAIRDALKVGGGAK